MVVSVVVGLRKISISNLGVFLMIDVDEEVDSVVGFQRGVELQAVVHGATVLCYGVKIGAGGVVDYEDVVHISRIKCYVF